MSSRSRVVVVVAFGHAQLLATTLAELDPTEEVVVVDNSSSAEVRAAVEQAGALYLDAGGNAGFAAGVNVALRHLADRNSSADVLLLNPDARISSAAVGRLQRVLDAAGNADVAAVAPALVAPDGTPQRVLWPFPSPARMWAEAVGIGRWLGTRDHFAVGAVLLLRFEALTEVGCFDERYFLYAEEADWQRRARELGWRSVLVPQATAVHVGSATSADVSRREALFHAAQETYIRRWFGPVGWTSYRLAALLGASVRALLSTGTRRRAALDRARTYRRGPRRQACLSTGHRPLRITHLVVTDGAAGTERYVSDVAACQATAGHLAVGRIHAPRVPKPAFRSQSGHRARPPHCR